MDYSTILAKEFSLSINHVKNIIALIDEGNTIPFIARYRKEMTGSANDQVLRDLADRLTYLTNLDARKEEVKNAIIEQGKWNDELAEKLAVCITLAEVEDVYRPYKQKKKTRASVAIEKGLSPLADELIVCPKGDIQELARPYVDEAKEVLSVSDALAGASDIIAERISDDADLRKELREYFLEFAVLETKPHKGVEDLGAYDMYKEYNERAKTMPAHRILAINRGEAEKVLDVSVSIDADAVMQFANKRYVKGACAASTLVETAAKDAYKRLIAPSLERELRATLTECAEEQSIKMFEVNLRPLLMQPPLHGKVIMALDPGYRTGCKVAIINEQGDVLGSGVVYPTPPQSKIAESKEKLLRAIARYKVNVISIGNGTASKETEIFVSDMLKECPTPVSYAIVNEAGASVYSASKLGAEEFPQFDVTIRSAVSIARRLQDPLAELIKIDVKSIGVGQYQHDMPQKRLTEVLEGVVEDCVNTVGVDLNTASYSLLSYVAGLNKTIAKNIVDFRAKTPFTTRDQLLEVPKLGAKAYEQCAGFLRIKNGKSVLDNTAVHPESYRAASKLLDLFGYTEKDVQEGRLQDLGAKISARGLATTAKECGVGELTLLDIADELKKPGRDVRDSLPKPVLRKELLSLENLVDGMILPGVVRNVVDFGAFVDIGVHQDGLVHISQITDRYIAHPREVLKVGDQVEVRVLSVDKVRGKISLSMLKEDKPATPRGKSTRHAEAQSDKPRVKVEESYDASLSKLLQRFGNK